MQILKPDFLSFTAQPLDWQGRMHHAMTVSFGFCLCTGAPKTAPEAWAAALQGLASGFCLDTGVPKKQTEWLLSGKAMAPEGAAVKGLALGVTVGDSRREWLVRGENQGTASFTEMPLTWANTWGGPENPHNPLGCGLKQDASGTLRAPTVLALDGLSQRPVCPGPMGAWPCRMQGMGTYDNAWLQQRWPGVPDDFDWAFFNLAQPEQRLPGGLKGGEHLVLTHMHPRFPRLEVTAPAHQVQVDIQRGADPQWVTLSAVRDTLWLFPGELTGLYFWHVLVPCADEAASDIAAVRLTLTPEIVEAEPPAEPAALAGAAVAGVAAAGAAVAGVAVAGGMAGGEEADSAAPPPQDAASPHTDESGESAPQSPLPAAPPLPPAESASAPVTPEPVSSAATMAEVGAEVQCTLLDSLADINASLAEAGQPPLTPDQIAETQARIAALTSALDETLNKPAPVLEDVLRQKGLSPERMAALQAVLEMDMPLAADAVDAAGWAAAVEAYVARFSELMEPSPVVTGMLRNGLLMSGPDGDTVMQQLLGGAPPTLEEALAQGGVDPGLAVSITEHLNDNPIPGADDMDALVVYGSRLEADLGLPQESIAGRLKALRSILADMGLLGAAGAVPPQALPEQAQPEQPQPEQPQPEQALPEQALPEQAIPEQAIPEQVVQPQGPQSREAVLLALALGVPLAGAVFANLELSSVDFSQQDLRGAVFDGAELAGADFSGSDVTGGSFAGVGAAGASFVGTVLAGVSFAGASAVDADFSGAVLEKAVLTGGDFTRAGFTGASLCGADAGGSVLDRAVFHECDLSGATFQKARFHRADFNAARASGASFAGADMTDASLGFGTGVAQADFSGACLAGSTWEGVDCRQAVFTRVKADNASFTDCDLSGASLKAARAREANFSRANLRGADVRGADLFKASLREAKVETTSFSGASLYGADLYRLQQGPETRLDGADTACTILDARRKGI